MKQRISCKKANVFIAFLLMTLILCELILPINAAKIPILTISSAETKSGNEVKLTISVQDNPGIAAAKIYVYYDTDTFALSQDSGVTAQGKFKSSGSLLTNPIAAAKKNSQYNGATDKDGILVLWYSGTGTSVSEDGAFLTLTLRTKNDAETGSYTIQLDVVEDDICNEKGESIAVSAGSSTVSVKGRSEREQPEQSNFPQTDTTEFSDIEGSWAEQAIQKATELELVKGYMGKYRPDDTMTRAEFVTILHRAIGQPEPTKKSTFVDLRQSWYMDAVAWAEQNHVLNGVGNGRFDPDGEVTREQLVTILYRLAGKPSGMELMLSSVYDSRYPDSEQISSWAKQALYWSIYEGIYCGEESEEIGELLAPAVAATRAQIAVMITRYLEKQS